MRLVVACLIFVTLACAFPVKHLAGPASEFSLHQIPDPATVETLQRSATRDLWFANADVLVSHKFPVESNNFVLGFASPVTGVRLELLGPSGNPVSARELQQTYFPDDSSKDEIPVTVYIVEQATPGTYTFNVHRTASTDASLLEVALGNPKADAVLMFFVNDDVAIHSHLQSYLLKPGQPIGLVASVSATTDSIGLVNMAVSKGTMQVTTPDGSTISVPMHDDGVKGGDLVANDQHFSGSIIASTPGVYILESILDGELSTVDGSTTDAFERTAQHIVAVTASTVELAGKAFLKPLTEGRSLIGLFVNNGQQPQPSLRAYSEVWGTASDGSIKPAAWIGGIVEVTPQNYVALELDHNWLKLAGVSGPLYLKNAYVSDLTTNFPVSVHADQIPVDNSRNFPRVWSLAPNKNITITKEMREGKNPLNVSRNAAAPNLLLLPGYCADVNPWARNSANFQNGFFPVDKGNYGNDEYAKKILAKAEAQGMTSFGIIAHSQGGMVATHIHNYYWSGLESATGGKLIQSVGTPYQGNTAAGSMANLGQVFGVGCGSNTDLSRDGAVAWLSGISTATRADVNFYTTTYKKGSTFGDWCSLPMNLVLEWPNDGVTEEKYAVLTGAKSMGNTEAWCHSTDMGYSAQYDDQNRNKHMNTAAAR